MAGNRTTGYASWARHRIGACRSGIWLCARRLNKGKFHWGETWRGKQLQLEDEQLAALVQGLPWQRVGAAGVISVL
ncbi:MAG: transposase [Gammaproteobacteria bacterium]|nr:transposase [Gammaproteobacteria bacterium]